MKEAKRIGRRKKRVCDMAILESTEAKTYGVQQIYSIFPVIWCQSIQNSHETCKTFKENLPLL
jgi:hypothetical protein